jgi:hypothetical protein
MADSTETTIVANIPGIGVAVVLGLLVGVAVGFGIAVGIAGATRIISRR